MKNPGGKKSKCKYKILTTHELITYIADLTGLFVFSWVNHKRKSRHQWSEIFLNWHYSQKGWSKHNTKMTVILGL